MAVVLADVLDDKQVVLDLRARTREEALGEIVALLKSNGKIEDAEKFLKAVIEREHENSTVAEHGVAFPHARTNLVDKIVLGVGRSRKGVSFGTSNKLIHIIFVIAVPQQMIQDYLVCVGALARLTKDKTIREELTKAQTGAEFVEQLRAASLELE
jgi:mannitol/fructose-specific phosphotransferase system IIA component (Ntr-type)